MPQLFDALAFARGPAMKNRFMLAPLTNMQSHDDGTLSEEEYRWLTMRAQGGFAITMTCAACVQAAGQGFRGQLGIYADKHIPGLSRLAKSIREFGSIGIVQLHHAGIRSPKELTGVPPVGPSEDSETGARALISGEVERLAEDFIAAAVRADRAGFDGVELHGAHGYILCAFLSSEMNRRTDDWGGTLENRARLLRNILAGIRRRCRSDFILGVRLSPERFGLKLDETSAFAGELMQSGQIDFLDMSLFDVFKEPAEPEHRGKKLISFFTKPNRGATRLGVAGKIANGHDATWVLEQGCDFAAVGRSAILHHDLPNRVAADPQFKPVELPVSTAHLEAEGVSPKFVGYLRNFKGFVREGEALEA